MTAKTDEPKAPTTPPEPVEEEGILHLAQLCETCGINAVPEGALAFACEHGSWALKPVATGGYLVKRLA
jgi:hypothetical protein